MLEIYELRNMFPLKLIIDVTNQNNLVKGLGIHLSSEPLDWEEPLGTTLNLIESGFSHASVYSIERKKQNNKQNYM